MRMRMRMSKKKKISVGSTNLDSRFTADSRGGRICTWWLNLSGRNMYYHYVGTYQCVTTSPILFDVQTLMDVFSIGEFNYNYIIRLILLIKLYNISHSLEVSLRVYLFLNMRMIINGLDWLDLYRFPIHFILFVL
jgi:hypothetical protein